MSESITVTITAKGQRGSGKSTVLTIAREALIKAGFEATKIYGDEVIYEEFHVTTGVKISNIHWKGKSR